MQQTTDGVPTAEAVASGGLWEREREIGVLKELIADASAGAGRLALVEGVAGIGKSRLVGEAQTLAGAAGFQVLTARGGELEQQFPFGIARQLFERTLTDPQVRERWLSGAAGAAATVFGSVDETPDDSRVSFAALHGLYWLAVNASVDTPLLLVVDDLQWCDGSSLRFLDYLARRLDQLPVLVIVAARVGDDAPQGSNAALSWHLVADSASMTIRPAALSDGAVFGLVREQLGRSPDPAFASECLRATTGNPLLLRELLRALGVEGVSPVDANTRQIREIGPTAVRRTVLLRLARLSSDALAVARAVAVADHQADRAVVAALAGLDEARVAAATRALVSAEILHPDQPNGFVHPLVRDAIYHDLGLAERDGQHARAARLLWEAGLSSEQVAGHLLVVSPRGDEWVADALIRAGRAAVRRGAEDSAVAYLTRALLEPLPEQQRAEVLFELGTAESLVNQRTRSVEHLRAAVASLTDPVRRGAARQVLARILLITGPLDEAVGAAQAGVAELPPEQADLRTALESVELFPAAYGAPGPEAVRRLVEARAGLSGDGPGARMLAAVASMHWALTGGSANESVALARSALSDGQLIATDPALMTGVAVTVLGLADCDDAVSVLERAGAQAHRSGSMFALSGQHVLLGWIWMMRGELVEAEQTLWLADQEDPPSSADSPANTGYARAVLLHVLVERGDLAGARSVLTSRGLPSPAVESLWRRGEVELLLAEGRFEAANQGADTYAAMHPVTVVNPTWVPWRSLKARALHGLGRNDEAVALLEKELVLARHWGVPGAIAQTLRVLGTVVGSGGLDLIGEAVEVTEGSASRLEHAKALAALGVALRRARRPADAREPLRHAVELATLCGASGLAARALAELATCGGRPRRTELTGVASLTPSERRVADLAAAGGSNHEIAQTLFVTPKTVEVHLSSTYRKLQIPGRAGLPGLLPPAREQGLSRQG
ncbi:MAG: AAA family ATPase [Terracoccus sp.]